MSQRRQADTSQTPLGTRTASLLATLRARGSTPLCRCATSGLPQILLHPSCLCSSFQALLSTRLVDMPHAARSDAYHAKLSQTLSWLELTASKMDFVTQMNAEETASYTQLLDLISLPPSSVRCIDRFADQKIELSVAQIEQAKVDLEAARVVRRHKEGLFSAVCLLAVMTWRAGQMCRRLTLVQSTTSSPGTSWNTRPARTQCGLPRPKRMRAIAVRHRLSDAAVQQAGGRAAAAAGAAC